MFDELQDVGHAVGVVEIDVALLLADECLVALGVEELPRTDEVLHDADVRAGFNIEIAGIEESADVQAWDEFVGLVFGVGGCALAVQVEVVAGWRLQVALLERFAVPGAVAFVDVHVVHVDGHPHVGGGIGNLVINMFVDEEVVGPRLAVADEIDTGLTHG